jgi:molybdenum-dependent DNA-binding transcriptional regulator ModE
MAGSGGHAVADVMLLRGELKLAGQFDALFFALLEAIDRTGPVNRAAHGGLQL